MFWRRIDICQQIVRISSQELRPGIKGVHSESKVHSEPHEIHLYGSICGVFSDCSANLLVGVVSLLEGSGSVPLSIGGHLFV